MQNPGNVAAEPVLVLNRTDVLSLFTWPGLIAAARRALVQDAHASSPEHVPGVAAQVALPGASLHLKAGVQSVPPMLSVKANLRPNAGSSSGAVLVFDLTQQRLRAIVASADVTALRTAAIAAVAASRLLTASPVVVAILGAGPVGRRVDEALAHLGIASEVRWWSRDAAHAMAAVSLSRGDVPHSSCESVEAAVAGALLVVTCTPARDPILRVDDLDPDAVVLAMGADTPGKRELGPGVLEAAGEIYADIPADALSAGESAYMSAEDASRIRPLGALLGPDAAPNPPSGKRTRIVFDSVGSSAVDAATLALLVEAATEAGVGSRVDLET
jgi:ornithine cyclodeaminase/alanine dehydrogenase-like protein (mu-crystallin family)